MNSVRRALAGAIVVIAVSAPVAADAADGLEVSWDGTAWSSNLPGSSCTAAGGPTCGQLFDPAERWVPGDDRTETFRVRNSTAARHDLVVGVEVTDDEGVVAEGDITMSIRLGTRPWQRLGSGTDGTNSVSMVLGGGEDAEVQVRATFEPTAPNWSQNGQVALAFRLHLGSPGSAPPLVGGPADSAGTGVEGDLPTTGAPWPGRLLVVAAVAIGAGAALVRSSSTRRGERHDPTT